MHPRPFVDGNSETFKNKWHQALAMRCHFQSSAIKTICSVLGTLTMLTGTDYQLHNIAHIELDFLPCVLMQP